MNSYESQFDSAFLEDVDVEYEIAKIGGRAAALVERSGLSLREVARRMGHKSPASVQRIIGADGAHNATLESLVRLARACGHRVEISFRSTCKEK